MQQLLSDFIGWTILLSRVSTTYAEAGGGVKRGCGILHLLMPLRYTRRRPAVKNTSPSLLLLSLAAALSVLPVATVHAQPSALQAAQPDTPLPEDPKPLLTMFPHPDSTRWYVAGQMNIILQAHPGFHSPYEGANSLLQRGEYKTSLLGTIYTGFELHKGPRYQTEALYDLESSGGRGISEALGLAGFTNLDVVRNPQIGSKPYTARIQLHQIIGLTDEMTDQERTFSAFGTKVPVRRFDLRAGKLSLPDIFDANGPGSDSHLQFMNWTVDNNGAWDYAAETRGYTYAVVAEYDDKAWSARYAVALMPTVANGANLNWNLRQARGENYELTTTESPLATLLRRLGAKDKKGAAQPGTVRLLGYINHGNMGLYRNAVNQALHERALGDASAVPVITAHTPGVTTKYGVGLNFEQNLTDDIRTFGRFGWNEGQHEDYCYTEVDQTFELGGDITGERWSRPNDRVGVVGVTNAIKRDHQNYLALGGQGFLLGDGTLQYGREDILETYYTAHAWRGLFMALDVQLIAHPGYNTARGPVAVFGVRSHVDF
jgi:high affinity Mn2+ porin